MTADELLHRRLMHMSYGKLKRASITNLQKSKMCQSSSRCCGATCSHLDTLDLYVYTYSICLFDLLICRLAGVPCERRCTRGRMLTVRCLDDTQRPRGSSPHSMPTSTSTGSKRCELVHLLYHWQIPCISLPVQSRTSLAGACAGHSAKRPGK
jgi:hypothetical protein